MLMAKELNRGEIDREETAKKVLKNVRTLCYFGSENYSQMQDAKNKFCDFLVAADQIVLFAKALKKKADQTRLKQNKLFQRVEKLEQTDIAYLAAIELTGDTITIQVKKEGESVKLRFYDFKLLFSKGMKIIFDKLGLTYLNNIPKDEWKYIETIIAAYTSNMENALFSGKFLSTLKIELPLKQVSTAEPKKFTTEIYLNAIKCLVYGFGNCELLSYLALIELIRIGGSDICSLPLQCVHFQPLNTQGEKLEELNFVAIGQWPNKGCLIICPWLPEENSIFYWQGSLEQTPQLLNSDSSIDTASSHIKITFRTSNYTINNMQNIIKKHHESFLELRKENILTIRRNFCDYLENFIGIEDETYLFNLKQMTPGQYLHGLEREPFAIPYNEVVSDGKQINTIENIADDGEKEKEKERDVASQKELLEPLSQNEKKIIIPTSAAPHVSFFPPANDADASATEEPLENSTSANAANESVATETPQNGEGSPEKKQMVLN
jgi:hypothetical protein